MLTKVVNQKLSPAPRRRSKSRKFQPFLPADGPIALLVCLPLWFAIIFLSSCSEGKSDLPLKAPPVPVTVGVVSQKTVPVTLKAIGNVEAYTSVAVKARVGGELQRVHFQEGQEVKQGDLLFTIDPRPYEAVLKEAQAKLARDRALLKKAQDDAQRYSRLIKDDLISREQYEQITANAQALAATVQADEAAVEHARLQVGYCYISSPVSGRTGSLLINQGNLIKAEDEKNPIVVIHQIQPIYVSFAVPEKYFPEIKTAMQRGTLPLSVVIAGDEPQPIQGKLTFIDNQVDRTTGTVRLKGTFTNEAKRLWPGQFVDVSLELSSQPNALVVPAQAVQTGQGEQFVFVVKPDHTVDYRAIQVERIINGEAVVNKGLSPGEQVVTDGQLRLVPGARVQIKQEPVAQDKSS
jgi:multidrug efflux system membrane fusion protein